MLCFIHRERLVNSPVIRLHGRHIRPLLDTVVRHDGDRREDSDNDDDDEKFYYSEALVLFVHTAYGSTHPRGFASMARS